MTLDEYLKPLQDVDGYLASAFFDISGDVLASHNNSKLKLDLVGANTVALFRAAMKTMNSAGLGKPHFVQINTESSILIAVWAVEEKSMSVVLLEPTGNIGLAKIQLVKVGEAGASQLA